MPIEFVLILILFFAVVAVTTYFSHQRTEMNDNELPVPSIHAGRQAFYTPGPATTVVYFDGRNVVDDGDSVDDLVQATCVDAATGLTVQCNGCEDCRCQVVVEDIDD
jgi:hypothetical protein